MKASFVASAFALLSSAAAAPGGGPPSYEHCVTQAQASLLVQRFVAIQEHVNSDLGTFNQTIEAILAPNYEEISDSILSLINGPPPAPVTLGGILLQGRENELIALNQAPPDLGIITVNALPAGCNFVLWQWIFPNVANGPYEVKGFNLFELNKKGQIKTAWIEFNSIAWGQDDGQLIPICVAELAAANATSSG